jgi:antirestriction protein ArdC
MVAELGAAFLCADLGITLEPREDHASYLAHWVAALREDKRAIFAAAAHAQKAVDFLHGVQPNAMPVPAETACPSPKSHPIRLTAAMVF